MARMCLIPARGGSKRIPQKNKKPFFGKPIVAHCISIALKSKLFDSVVVSTDDNDIRSIAMSQGAKVPGFRSPENSSDHASLADVVDEVEEYFASQDEIFKEICLLLPTAVLVTPQMLDEGLKLLECENFASVRPVVRFDYPIQRAFRLESNNSVKFVNPELKYTRSQDLEEYYHDSGQFYWFKTGQFRDDNKGAFVVNGNAVQDIDTLDDWHLAELKYEMMLGENSR